MTPRITVASFLLAMAFVIIGLSAGRTAAPSAKPADDLGFDESKPISVNADNFAADLKNEIGTYTGNVIVIQGMMTLHADTVVVSAPQGKASHMEARGHVVINTPSGVATGETGIYEVGTRVMRLNGNVVLTKDQNVMRGGALEVQVATGEAHLVGGASTAPNQIAGQTPKSGRVQGLFAPSGNPATGVKP